MYFLLVLRKKSHCLSVKLSQCHVRADELRQILGVGITASPEQLDAEPDRHRHQPVPAGLRQR